MFVVGQGTRRQRVDHWPVWTETRSPAEPIVTGDGAPPAAQIVPLTADGLAATVDHTAVGYAFRPGLAKQNALGAEEVQLAWSVGIGRRVQIDVVAVKRVGRQ